MQTKTEIIILGAGGHGRVIADICADLAITVRGFIDPNTPAGQLIDDIPVLGGDHLLSDPTVLHNARLILGIGDPEARKRLVASINLPATSYVNLVHASAVVSHRASMESGTIVCAGAVIGTGARLSHHVVINTSASIDHDCQLGRNVQVSPGAVLAGGVICEDDVFIGSGATIIPGIRIEAGAVVAAGAVVTKTVTAGTRVAGIPARTMS